MNELGTCEQDMYEQGISELGRLENLSGDMEKNPYRPYYFENPKAYDSPIRSWEEFCRRFRTEFAAHMPKEAPTYMNPRKLLFLYWRRKNFNEKRIVLSRWTQCRAGCV